MRSVSSRRLLCVHAHPDDESSKGAASMARYVSEGADVLVVTCTGGELGSVLNPAMDRPDVRDRLPEIRREEMDRAREILGVQQEWLGFMDSGLPEGDPKPPLPEGCFALVPVDQAAAPLVRILREFRPQVVVTYDENGGYPHPDHIQTHLVSMAAIEGAADPERYPEAGAPWQVAKTYFVMTFHKARVLALQEAMVSRGLESPYEKWLERWEDRPSDEHRITTRVPCAEWFPLRDRALLAHATQVDPNGTWFQVPMSIQQQAWPTEDYQLIDSRVEVGPLPESDLFAGIATAIV
jgi:mycothiol S-conjugate amidase